MGEDLIVSQFGTFLDRYDLVRDKRSVYEDSPIDLDGYLNDTSRLKSKRLSTEEQNLGLSENLVTNLVTEARLALSQMVLGTTIMHIHQVAISSNISLPEDFIRRYDVVSQEMGRFYKRYINDRVSSSFHPTKDDI